MRDLQAVEATKVVLPDAPSSAGCNRNLPHLPFVGGSRRLGCRKRSWRVEQSAKGLAGRALSASSPGLDVHAGIPLSVYVCVSG